MANEDLKVGDVVQLKSGGSNMTIESINDDDVICAWFDKNGEAKKKVFNKDSLEKTNGNDGRPIIVPI